MSKIEGKIPNISVLATTNTLTSIGNKIPNFSNLVKKKKQIMTQKYQILKVNKSIFPGFINNTDLNKKSNTSSKSKIKSKAR